MVKTLVAAALFVTCLSGCQNSGGSNGAQQTVLNVGDVYKEFNKSKEELRAKYEGKEVVVLGMAMKDFDPEFYGAETQDVRLLANMDDPNTAVYCTVHKADAAKFVGLQAGAVIAVKGVLHVKEFAVEVMPCQREFQRAQ